MLDCLGGYSLVCPVIPHVLTHPMDPFTYLGGIGTGLALLKHLISSIDLIVGACTNNTPAAALWLSVLAELRTEFVHAQDQLNLVKGEIEPMRVKQGAGADAANLKRKELAFDELLVELTNQLKESEGQIGSATDKLNQTGFFRWVLFEALGTLAREAVAPVQEHVLKLKTIRLRVHSARQVIIDAFLAHCYNHAGDRFPTLESLGGIRDRLALNFLSPEPFCHQVGPEDNLTSGLLQCNRSDVTLKELHNRIQEMGVHWVRGVRQEAANPESTSPITTLDVLEKCQKKMLAQLDKGIFGVIIDSNSLFTTNDRTAAIRGRCAIQDWRSIWLGGGGGIVIALGGKMSAGKSSIINAMLGRSLLPTESMSSARW